MRSLVCTLALMALSSVAVSAQQTQFDILITNGTIIDGSGASRFRGDIAIKDNRIVRVEHGSIRAPQAKRTIDATGLIVAPGFIDLHAHLDPLPQMPAFR